MKYRSTRGGVSGLSFEEALYTGYADDGGLLVPESVPQISTATLETWRAFSYTDVVKEVVHLFVGDEIPKSHLEELIDKAFSSISHPAVAPMTRLPQGLNVLEMYHGPTLTYKDMALTVMARILEYFLSRRKQHVVIFVGTTGDTGGALIEAVRGLKYVDAVVLYPKGRCSEIQVLHMTSVPDHNIHVFCVDGSCDEIDVPIKKIFMDVPFKKRHNITSANSLNWCRVMTQTAHLIYAYLQLCPTYDGEVEIVIPSGGLGSAAAGCIVRRMGVPVRLVCAVTVNDIVARTIQTGDFSQSEQLHRTLANAMDCQVPSNMERVLSFVSHNDAEKVHKIMEEFYETGRVKVPDELLQKMRSVIVDSFVASDNTIRGTMKKVWEEYQYPICPHTATGVAYHLQKLRETPVGDIPRVCVATASAKKFPEAVTSAGLTPEVDDNIENLFKKQQHFITMNKEDNWEEILRQKIEEIFRRE